VDELSLEQAAQAFHDSHKATFVGILWVKCGKIIKVNAQFLRIFQMDEIDLVGSDWLDLVHPASRERVKLSMKRLGKDIKSFQGIDVQLVHPQTAQTIQAVMAGFAIYGENEKVHILIKHLMQKESCELSSSTKTGWLKWVVQNWQNVAAILTLLAGFTAILWQKLPQHGEH
jgi:hypothetical protein